MEQKESGQRALILGAGGGMGSCIAEMLARRGVVCGLASRDPARLEPVVSRIGAAGGKAVPLELDLTRPETLAPSVERAVSALGGLDILLHCAGAYVSAKAQEADLDAWDGVLDTNFRGFVHVLRHALPSILKRPGGAVIAIGSITSAYSGGAMQVASKQALSGFLESLFEDVRERGTKVCAIHPGYVNTPMVRADRLDRERMIQPEDIARTVAFVLDAPQTVCPVEIVLRPQRSPYR